MTIRGSMGWCLKNSTEFTTHCLSSLYSPTVLNFALMSFIVVQPLSSSKIAHPLERSGVKPCPLKDSHHHNVAASAVKLFFYLRWCDKIKNKAVGGATPCFFIRNHALNCSGRSSTCCDYSVMFHR